MYLYLCGGMVRTHVCLYKHMHIHIYTYVSRLGGAISYDTILAKIGFVYKQFYKQVP